MEPVGPERRREIMDAIAGVRSRSGASTSSPSAWGGSGRRSTRSSGGPEGGAGFKAIRGDYGAGKTFFARWLQERAKRRGFAAAEVQISEADTRCIAWRRSTAAPWSGSRRRILSRGLSGRSSTAGSTGWRRRSWPKAGSTASDGSALAAATQALLEKRLSAISRVTRSSPWRCGATAGPGPRATRHGRRADRLAGGPAARRRRAKQPAGIKGDVNHFAALNFLRGLLTVLRDSGYAGLVLVLDEIETLQRVHSDIREKGLNALRQLIDEVDAGRYPGLYVIITGTPAFYDGPQGVRRLEPLAQRLHVDFGGDPRFDNLRAVQVQLPGFDHDRLVEVGRKVRDLYAQDA